jgi:hypothetical protein
VVEKRLPGGAGRLGGDTIRRKEEEDGAGVFGVPDVEESGFAGLGGSEGHGDFGAEFELAGELTSGLGRGWRMAEEEAEHGS